MVLSATCQQVGTNGSQWLLGNHGNEEVRLALTPGVQNVRTDVPGLLMHQSHRGVELSEGFSSLDDQTK